MGIIFQGWSKYFLNLLALVTDPRSDLSLWLIWMKKTVEWRWRGG
jgi:hypothetical protein